MSGCLDGGLCTLVLGVIAILMHFGFVGFLVFLIIVVPLVIGLWGLLMSLLRIILALIILASRSLTQRRVDQFLHDLRNHPKQ
jgi:hypothetical protein